MTILDHFNNILTYIPLVDKQDLSVLPAIVAELEQIMLDENVPEALLLQVTRCCKLVEHIALNETDFDKGINKLSQNVNRLLTFVEKSDLYKSPRNPPPEIGDVDSVDTFDQVADEIVQFRIKFASTQKSILEDFERCILAFEKGDKKSSGELKRILHTWKGEFGVLELPVYSSLIHEVEDAFENNNLTADQLFYFKDFISNQLSMIASGTFSTTPDFDRDKLFSISTRLAAPDPDAAVKPQIQSDSHNERKIEPHVPQFNEMDNSLLSDFIVESRDHIHTAESFLLTLESDPSNNENINSIFRCCHTIKGVAGFINLHDLCDFAHTMESMLDNSRKGELRLNAAHIDLLLRSMDCLKEIILIIEECMSGIPYRLPQTYSDILLTLKYVIQNRGSFPAVNKNQTDFNAAPPSLQHNVKSEKQVENTDQEPISPSPEKNVPPVHAEVLSGEHPSQSVQGKTPAGLEESIRVPVQRLDQLIDAIGEAVIAQSMITADPSIRSSKNQSLHTKVAQTTMIMRQIQELSMSLRMVSLKSTFQKMARLVRDLSKKSGKEIQFMTEGEDTELDKSVVEHISDPLMHMIRNSIDHGLESPQEREVSGKPLSGTVELRAYHKAGSVYIEIRDDGKGLDKTAILNKAVSKELCKPDDKLTDAEIYQFIFMPGFSTAKIITDISGRGVGMDVVRRNIESLRGFVDITTEPGKGTTFTIRLPLTLAIIDGMIVRVDSSNYIVPTLSIVETIVAKSDQLVNVLDKGSLIKVRDKLIPLVYLSEVFSSNNMPINNSGKIALIVEDMIGRKSAILVDEIVGQQQVVIKNLGTALGDIAGISGGAIMSDGTVSLIIDVGGILKSAYN